MYLYAFQYSFKMNLKKLEMCIFTLPHKTKSNKTIINISQTI